MSSTSFPLADVAHCGAACCPVQHNCQTEGSLGRNVGPHWTSFSTGKRAFSELACATSTGLLPPKQMGIKYARQQDRTWGWSSQWKMCLSYMVLTPSKQQKFTAVLWEMLQRNYSHSLMLEFIPQGQTWRWEWGWETAERNIVSPFKGTPRTGERCFLLPGGVQI